LISSFSVILLTDKQTDTSENITSLAKVNVTCWHARQRNVLSSRLQLVRNIFNFDVHLQCTSLYTYSVHRCRPPQQTTFMHWS